MDVIDDLFRRDQDPCHATTDEDGSATEDTANPTYPFSVQPPPRTDGEHQWTTAARTLGLTTTENRRRPDRSWKRPETLFGEIDTIDVKVSYFPDSHGIEGGGQSEFTGFYAVLSPGPYDEHRVVIRRRTRISRRVMPFRFAETGNQAFDSVFDIKARGAAADFAVGYLTAGRRNALVALIGQVPSPTLYWSTSRIGRPRKAPPGASLLFASVDGRADADAISTILNALVVTCRSLET